MKSSSQSRSYLGVHLDAEALSRLRSSILLSVELQQLFLPAEATDIKSVVLLASSCVPVVVLWAVKAEKKVHCLNSSVVDI